MKHFALRGPPSAKAELGRFFFRAKWNEIIARIAWLREGIFVEGGSLGGEGGEGAGALSEPTEVLGGGEMRSIEAECKRGS